MKIFTLSMSGIAHAEPVIATNREGQKIWAVANGSAHGGRFGASGEVLIPFGVRDFPVQMTTVTGKRGGLLVLACGHEVPVGHDAWMPEGHAFCCRQCNHPPSGFFQVRDLADGHYLIVAAREEDGRQIMLWHLSPGYGGGAKYSMDGEVRLLAQGRTLFGNSTKDAAPAPIVQVRGPCCLRWERFGQIGRSPACWEAKFDGNDWRIERVKQVRRKDACA